jgi:hypothetical protein
MKTFGKYQLYLSCLLFLLFCLSFAAINANADTIIDNRDAATSRAGTWSVSSGSGSYGLDSVFSRKNTTATPTFTWYFTPSQSGNYELSMWWTYRDTRSTSVPVDIEYSGGTARVVVNQKLNGSTWNVLGTYPFAAGVSYKVTITAQPIPTSDSTTCADAVKFAPVTQAYTISATAGSGGSMSPSGPVSVPTGADQTFTITPNTGYHVADVVVDGGTVGIIDSYTFYDVTSNHTIGATFAVDNPSQETIIDNRDAATSHTGTWSVSSGGGSYGVDSVFGRNGATFTWNFTPSQSGNYEVSMWWTYRDSRSTNIPVDIEHSKGTDRIFINQKQTLSDWYVLGTYSFEAGVSYSVTVTAQPYPSSSSTTCADAVKFILVQAGNTPPVATIVSINPNPALPGETVTFAGHGTDSDGDDIVAWNWHSKDMFLSDSATFSTNNLSEGLHIVYFKVQDSQGAWSSEASIVIGHLGCDAPLRIMPLGDSVTEGIYDNTEPCDPATQQCNTTDLRANYRPEEYIIGYRRPLSTSLMNAGYFIDFVGSSRSGQSVTPSFDFDHQGMPGMSASQIASNVYHYLTTNNSDIVLLHTGTAGFISTTPADVENILNEIDRFEQDNDQDITVVLARIINRKTYNPDVHAFNEDVAAIAENRIANGDKIIIVDFENALTYPDDLFDNLHPNNSGYNKMADVWLAALENILPVCEQIPLSIVSALAGSGGNISPSGAVPVRYGADQAFTITPNNGYHIVDVMVDGGSEGVIQSYAFYDVTSNHTIAATFAVDNLSQETIIDNHDTATSKTGTWSVSSGSGSYGVDSVFSRKNTTATPTFTWNFTPSQSGDYQVSMWWTYRDSRSTSIPVDIEYSGGTASVVVNQKLNGSTWNVLGTYPFAAGVSYKVTVTAQPIPTSESTTCADAVKFAPITQTYTISATAGSGGSISPSGAVSVPDGADQTFNITTSAGYHIADVVVDGGSEGVIQSYTFYDVTSDHTIAATFAVDNPSQDPIIDNRDAATSHAGTWSVSSGGGSYGVDSVFGRNGATFTWHFTPSQNGNYQVSMWWTYRDSRSTSVPVDIEYSGGTARVVVNQKLNGSTWNVLSAYPFVAGVSYNVTVTAQPIPASSSTTCADAVKFAYLGGGTGNIAPQAVIVSINPNPALPGQTVTFAGSGTDSDGTITGYSWRSSNGEVLSTSATFSKTFSEGSYTIYFKVKDNQGAWSPEVNRTLQVSSQTSNIEHIYIGPLYDSAKTFYYAVLKTVGAKQEGDIWKYTNTSQNKTYNIHFLEDIESTRQAMYAEGAHIILQGHANYGLGGVYSTIEENTQGKVYDLYYMDDDRLLNWSSPWIALNVESCIESHAFPNWWPVFKDGTTAVMPYVHGDPQGDPPYNYYITYQVPGDSMFYKVRGLRRFPDSGKPAWYSADGGLPSPANPDHLQYYITNTDTSPVTNLCGSRICPRPHYGKKTIVFRSGLDVEIAKLKYKRMLYTSCTSGIYYLDTFHRGLMFYSVVGVGGGPSTMAYLKAYLEGKSDHEIWEIMQAAEPAWDYYDFSKRPSEQ